MKLELYKNEIIPVYVTSLGNKVVKAREVYDFLEIKEKFSDWVKRKISEHDLLNSKDYCIVSDFSESMTKTGKRRVSKKEEYIIRLHAGKKIALGTNNKKGDEIKDYFIRCEETFKQTILNINDYTNRETQKGLAKQVNGVLFTNGATSDILEHHQINCKIHFGLTPSQLRKSFVSAGHRVKSFSGREIARKFKPEAACSMAYHDEMVAKGHTLEKMQAINLREKLEPAFKAMIELGFTPSHLIG